MKFAGLHSTLKLTVAAAAVCAIVPAAFGQGIGEYTLQDLMISTPKKVQRGGQLYRQSCASCHGATGQGDGPTASTFPNGVGDFTTSTLGPIEMQWRLEKGVNNHPLFEHMVYQDLWAVTHYVRSFNPANTVADPPSVLEQALFEAREGVCNPAVKSGITAKTTPPPAAQLEAVKAVFASNCASCHGDTGDGKGSGAAALNPAPRDFHAGDGWTNGTSALSIFNTIAMGIDGTSMAGFKHLSEEDRWALTHLIREQWLPASAKAESTPDELEAVCRSLSGGSTMAALKIDDAINFLVKDLDETRLIRMTHYGTAWIDDNADANRGQQVYETHCSSCHGPRGVGTEMGPYGSQPPYLKVKVGQLEPGLAGGTYKEFAKRSIGGAHTAIPDVTGASHITEDDWRALQAYVTSFEGFGDVQPASQMPQPPAAASSDAATEETPAPAEEPQASQE